MIICFCWVDIVIAALGGVRMVTSTSLKFITSSDALAATIGLYGCAYFGFIVFAEGWMSQLTHYTFDEDFVISQMYRCGKRNQFNDSLRFLEPQRGKSKFSFLKA